MIVDDTMNKYFKIANSYELLTSKREKELADTIREFKGGKQKQAAREELMNHNLRLVIKMAFQFYNNENNHPRGRGRSELTIMDLISAGNVGLMKAVDLYNPRKYKTRFTTYAVSWIKQGMFSLLYSYNTAVHVPMHILNDSKKYRDIIQKDKNGKLRDEDMMSLLDITQKGLYKIKNSKVFTFSMDASIPSKNRVGKNDDNGGTYKEFIPDNKQVSPFEETAKSDTSEVIKKAMDTLDPISRDVIDGQFLNPNKVKLSDLGKKHKMSGERIRQIKENALKKLKWRLKGKSLTQV